MRESVIPSDQPLERPILVVVCDVEEEFDWSAPFDRRNTSVDAMRYIERLQETADCYQLPPTYVIDYPVASQTQGYLPLQELLITKDCEIGAHLHPWVTPPFEEEVSRYNSFAGNLPASLERAKLRQLTRAIRENLGVEPKSYKAGRYGVGTNSYRILQEEGFEVDLSAMPSFDFSGEGGPDFTSSPLRPSVIDGPQSLIVLPQTGAYVGFLSSQGRRIYPIASAPKLRSLRLPALLSRLRLIDRLVLTPEGYSFGELKRLTREVLHRGIKVLCFSLHSPSLLPGCTPYVEDESDLDRFLATCREYFDFFRSEIGGVGMTASQARAAILNRTAGGKA